MVNLWGRQTFTRSSSPLIFDEKSATVDGEASVALWKDPLWGTCKSRNNTTIDVNDTQQPKATKASWAHAE